MGRSGRCLPWCAVAFALVLVAAYLVLIPANLVPGPDRILSRVGASSSLSFPMDKRVRPGAST
jgi:hypothetical protein